MSTIAPRQRSTLPPPSAYRLSVDEYERLVEAGVLKDPRVELIDGYPVKKMAKNPPHIWVVDRLLEISKPLTPGWWCRKEDPVRIPDFDEPEPDVAVVRGSRDDYRNRLPGAQGRHGVVIEVAETTLDRDQIASKVFRNRKFVRAARCRLDQTTSCRGQDAPPGRGTHMRTLTLGLVMAMAMTGWGQRIRALAQGSQPPETSPKAAAKPAATAGQSKEHWTPLFNGRDLDGWYTFLQKHGKNSDPDRVITIEDGAIHLYKTPPTGADVVMGYIGTEKEYGELPPALQYRWGTKKFEPRLRAEARRRARITTSSAPTRSGPAPPVPDRADQRGRPDRAARHASSTPRSTQDPRRAMPTFQAPSKGASPVLGGDGTPTRSTSRASSRSTAGTPSRSSPAATRRRTS